MSPEHTVEEVAHRLKYSDAFAFWKQFKRATGQHHAPGGRRAVKLDSESHASA